MAYKEKIPVAAATRPTSAPVTLIPWDADSLEQIERLFQQRIACGWCKDMIDEWRQAQREGRKAIHWVVLVDTDPDKETKLSQHIAVFPKETESISDTARFVGGKPRVPSEVKFGPVGHISLDLVNPDLNLADAANGIYHISTLYISKALQGSGLGRAAMDAVEEMAIQEPYRGKVLTIRTMIKECSQNEERNKALGNATPKISNQDWYQRRGYEVFETVERCWVQTDAQGREWGSAAVLMKRTIC